MAVETTWCQDVKTRNREGSESKKKLKKKKKSSRSSTSSSIRPSSNVPTLKPSVRKSKPRINWLSIEEAAAASTAVDLSDSLPNYMRATSSSEPKEGSPQGGSEIDDTASVASSSYKSLVMGLPSLNQATRIQKMMKTSGRSTSLRRRVRSRILQPSFDSSSNDAGTPQRPSSSELSDGWHNYLKETSSSERKKVNSQASSGNSESSPDGNDHGSSKKSSLPSQRSLQTLVRMPSIRIIRNKTSFKPKRSALKNSPISVDLNVDRATCSSTLKGKQFPEHVEPHSEPTDAERMANIKVCPYHHCSLHGHHHDPAPPVKRSLYKKRQLLKSQKSMKSGNKWTSGMRYTGSKNKYLAVRESSVGLGDSSQEASVSRSVLSPVKDDMDKSLSIEIYAKIRANFLPKSVGEMKNQKAVEIPLGESSFSGKGGQESLNQMMSTLAKTISDLKEKSERCCCETDNSHLVSGQVDSGIQEVVESNVGNKDQETIIDHGNADCSATTFPADKGRDQSQNNSNLIGGESWKGGPSPLAENSNSFDVSTEVMNSSTLGRTTLGELKTGQGEKTSNSGPDDVFIVGSTRVTPDGDSESRQLAKADTSTLADNSSDFDKETEDKTESSSTSGSNTLDDLKMNRGDKESNSGPDDKLVSGHAQVGGSDTSGLILGRDPGPAVSDEGNQAPVNKDKHFSMWHLIHRHMASGLHSDGDRNAPSGGDEGEKVHDTFTVAAPTKSETTQNPSDLDSESQDKINQEIELRKVLAIKLVREAIEKILLPEVPDHLSDDQSVTSDTMSEQEFSEKNHDEEPAEDDIEGEGHENTSAYIKESNSNADKTFGPERTEMKVKVRPVKKAPKHWSNLKKWILLQRFIKALEKVRRFDTKKLQQEVEPDPDADKMSLRHQTVQDKKRAEEWMFDYALRQAIDQLAPTQKRKVALLVKAFETVVPPQEDSGIHRKFSNLKGTSDESRYSGKGEDIKGDTSQDAHEISSSEINEKRSVIGVETKPCLLKISSSKLSNTDTMLDDIKSSFTGHLQADVSPSSSSVDSSHTDKIVQQMTLEEETNRRTMAEPSVLQRSYLMGSKSDDKDEDNKNYFKMWHMVYQHVVTNIAEKVGPKLLDEAEDEGDATKLSESSLTNQDAGGEKYSALLRSRFSKSDAIKLVQEAVKEIQDASPETEYVTGDEVPEHELEEKNRTEDGLGKLRGSEGAPSLNQEGLSVDSNTKLEEMIPESVVQTKSELPKPKSWSKLRKIILLKRSINALEKARTLTSQTHKDLPLPTDPQPEKVDLRRQMMDERKKAEQWMLDYAVQNIVHKLTPARKRRVAMLVEAFEAVVPLPEI